MFKKFASDVIGLSDVGSIINPENYNATDSDDYILDEDGEKIYFLIKSKSDEYCFTNQALIHLDGTSATSKKRMLKRYSYNSYQISDVRLETAGTIDRDVEIKFVMGNEVYSIDVDKKQIDKLKELYKSLVKISSTQYKSRQELKIAENSLVTTAQALSGKNNTVDVSSEFQKVNEYVFAWGHQKYEEYAHSDYSEIFEKFVK